MEKGSVPVLCGLTEKLTGVEYPDLYGLLASNKKQLQVSTNHSGKLVNVSQENPSNQLKGNQRVVNITEDCSLVLLQKIL